MVPKDPTHIIYRTLFRVVVDRSVCCRRLLFVVRRLIYMHLNHTHLGDEERMIEFVKI